MNIKHRGAIVYKELTLNLLHVLKLWIFAELIVTFLIFKVPFFVPTFLWLIVFMFWTVEFKNAESKPNLLDYCSGCSVQVSYVKNFEQRFPSLLRVLVQVDAHRWRGNLSPARRSQQREQQQQHGGPLHRNQSSSCCLPDTGQHRGEARSQLPLEIFTIKHVRKQYRLLRDLVAFRECYLKIRVFNFIWILFETSTIHNKYV